MWTLYVEKKIPQALLTKSIAPRWHDFVWTPFSVTRIEDIARVPLPGPRWLRVRNEMCGICASDLSLLFVKADPAIAPAALPANERFYLGHEVVSTVVEVGTGVTRFRVGDRVLMDTHFDGANCATLEITPPCRYCAEEDYHFCENRSAPGPRGIGGGFGEGYITHETAVYPCPPDLSLDAAVLVEPMAVAVHAVMRFPPQPGERVLVLGAGIIGLLVTMTLRALVPSCEVTVIARHTHQAAMAERLGAQRVLRGRPTYQTIAQVTGGKYFSAILNKGIVVGGFDRVYDCVATAETVNDALRWTRAGGTVVMIGAHMAPMSQVDLTLVWYHHINLVGSYAHGVDEWHGVRKHTYEWVFDFLRAGKFVTEGLITHRFPFAEYRRAIAVASDKQSSRAIKVVLTHHLD